MKRPNRRLPLWWQRAMRWLFDPRADWDAHRSFLLSVKAGVYRRKQEALLRYLYRDTWRSN